MFLGCKRAEAKGDNVDHFTASTALFVSTPYLRRSKLTGRESCHASLACERPIFPQVACSSVRQVRTRWWLARVIFLGLSCAGRELISMATHIGCTSNPKWDGNC